MFSGETAKCLVLLDIIIHNNSLLHQKIHINLPIELDSRQQLYFIFIRVIIF